MKHRTFRFYFKCGHIETTSSCYDSAKILAQAEAIKNAWDYEVTGAFEIENHKVSRKIK